MIVPRTVMMVRPAAFGTNPETAASNAFQHDTTTPGTNISMKALAEFDAVAAKLAAHDVDVRVFQDTPEPVKPDAIFPNNWVSFHPDGRVILYPMMAPNRRLERRNDIIESIKTDCVVTEVVDLSSAEREGQFLEGTGSIVFDHEARTLFASHSPRTDAELVGKLAGILGYRAIVFHSLDRNSAPVYHTNVMMALGRKFCLLCLDSIRDEDEQETLLGHLSEAGKKVIAISFDQMYSFAGNVMEVETVTGEPQILISTTANSALLKGQREALSKFGGILTFDIPTIEKYGGGSVRCMVAGVHLPGWNSVPKP